jgi:hypothetical protein
MRHCFIVPALLAAMGCSDGLTSDPDTPGPLTPGPAPLAQVWGMVVDENGVCIPNATVRVVQGQALDTSAAQTIPCDAWAYDGGFLLRNLTPGLSMTIRASAPGYLSLTKTITPSLGPQTAVLFVPTKE